MTIAIFIVSMLVGIVIGLPTAVALLLCAMATVLALDGGDANPTTVAHTLMQDSDSVTMMALPSLMPTGEIMNRDGLTKRIIALCNTFIECVCGGLSYVTILACLMFASLVSSAVATCAAPGAILIPIMANFGYDREKVAVPTMSTNLVVPIMLPLMPMIIYGIAAGASIKSLLMGGTVPAVCLTIIASMAWFSVSRKKGIVPDTEAVSGLMPKKAAKTILAGLWTLLLPVTILVSSYSGYLTATEAGVIAYVYTILIGLLVYHEMKIKNLIKAFVASARMSAVVMFSAAATNCAVYFTTISRVPQVMTSDLEGLVERPTLLMFVLICIVVVVGLTMGVVPNILIPTPIILSLIKVAEINPVYPGIMFMLMDVLGLTPPPVGPVLNVAYAADRVKMDKIILLTMPYFIAQMILCFLLALVPIFVEVPLRWLGG